MPEEKKVLGFEVVPTDYVFYSRFRPAAKTWGSLIPRFWEDKILGPGPMSAAVNYGLSVFEGMKAFRHESGKIFLFRPKDHAERFSQSARGLLMPPFPEELFLEALHLLVAANAEFVPEYRQGSLYIRPIAYGGDKLGYSLNPDLNFTAAFWCSPVGNYYTDGLKPISINVERNITRAMPGGIGYCKASGNYEISRKAQFIAKQKDCQDALFLDGKTKKHIEELGAANVFTVKGNVIYTPRLRDTILPGITRRSIMTLAKKMLGLKVRERNITVQQLIGADEAFASGTAAVITPIGKIRDGDNLNIYTIGNGEVGEITRKLYDLFTGIQHGVVKDDFGWLTEVKF